MLAFLALPAGASASTKSGHAVVSIEKPTGGLGQVLVDAAGQTLYVYTLDHANHSTCTGGCAKVWPPLLLHKGTTKAVAGPGVKDLGTIRRGGRLQVTSHKMPLYLYAGDTQKGQTSGEGVEGTWFVALATGTLPPAAPTTTPPPPTTAATTPPATTPPVTTPPVTTPPATDPASDHPAGNDHPAGHDPPADDRSPPDPAADEPAGHAHHRGGRRRGRLLTPVGSRAVPERGAGADRVAGKPTGRHGMMIRRIPLPVPPGDENAREHTEQEERDGYGNDAAAEDGIEHLVSPGGVGRRRHGRFGRPRRHGAARRGRAVNASVARAVRVFLAQLGQPFSSRAATDGPS